MFDDLALLDPQQNGAGGNGRVGVFLGQATRYSGVVPFGNASFILSHNAHLRNTEVFGLGNLDASPDAFDDFALSSEAGSFLIQGRTAPLGTLLLSGLANVIQVGSGVVVIPMGDLDGDGDQEVGALVFEQSPKLVEDGTSVEHAVGHLYVSVDWSVGVLPEPDLVFEPDRPTYFDGGSGLFSIHRFASPGDVSGDAKDDVVLAEILGDEVQIYEGIALAVSAPEEDETSSELPAELFEFDLATPNFIPPTSSGGTGINLNDPDNINIRDAFALEGADAEDQLSKSQIVGDFDGDGNQDLLVYGAEKSYVFLGPINISGLDEVTDKAQFIVDTSSLGLPAQKMGDINADGKADLVFYRHLSTNETLITIVYGGRVLPRELSFPILDTRFSRVIRIQDSEIAPSGFTVEVGPTSGQRNSVTGRLHHDVVVFSGQSNADKVYGYIFHGSVLSDQSSLPPGTEATVSNASVALKLFTRVADSGEVEVPIPNLDQIASGDIPKNFPVFTTESQTTPVNINDATRTTHNNVPKQDTYSDPPSGGFFFGEFPYYFAEIPIFDHQTAVAPLDITGLAGVINTVVVTFELEHTYTGDLDIFLTSPSNTTIQLVNRQGGSGNNFTNTTLSDAAGTSIVGQSAPFTGTFRPVGLLSAFAGENPNGQWKLSVADRASQDNGWIKRFQLDIDTLETQDPDDFTTVTSDINVTGFGSVNLTDLNVTLDLTHTNVGDLRVTLTHGSQTVQLFNKVGQGGTAFSSTTFDDEATTSINSGVAPFLGSFKPAQALTGITGSPDGLWQLSVTDTVGSGGTNPVGVLNSWSITFSTDQVTTSNLIINSLPTNAVISDVNIDLDITHPDVSDLKVVLKHSGGSGTSVTLVDQNTVVSGANFTGTTFDDESATPIAGSSAVPFTGTFSPLGNLSDFDSLNPNTTWVLEITDKVGEFTGMLNSWSLSISTSAVESTIEVSDVLGDITDLDVELSVTHTNVEDLDIYVTSPEGTRIKLIESTDVSGGHYTGTILDDEGIALTTGGGPYTGRFRPSDVQTLAAFDGEDANGTWALEIFDVVGQRTGILNSWSLAISYEPEEVRATLGGDFNGDGLDDLMVETTGIASTDAGRVYVLISDPDLSSTARLDRDAGLMVEGAFLGGGLSALGDLNKDGYDDFGASRTREDAGNGLGGLLVFFGSGNLDRVEGEAPEAANEAAALIVRQATASELGTTSLVGSLAATAGDINSDGEMDLIVSQQMSQNVTAAPRRFLIPRNVVGSSSSIRW